MLLGGLVWYVRNRKISCLVKIICYWMNKINVTQFMNHRITNINKSNHKYPIAEDGSARFRWIYKILLLYGKCNGGKISICSDRNRKLNPIHNTSHHRWRLLDQGRLEAGFVCILLSYGIWKIVLWEAWLIAYRECPTICIFLVSVHKKEKITITLA